MAIKYISPTVLTHIDVLTHCRYLILLSRQGKVVRIRSNLHIDETDLVS